MIRFGRGFMEWERKESGRGIRLGDDLKWERNQSERRTSLEEDFK